MTEAFHEVNPGRTGSVRFGRAGAAHRIAVLRNKTGRFTAGSVYSYL